ncbi:MAG: ABC transporter permease [Victivallales bacterium]|nr:ABC transporter permease [Victivallales bacterium]
MKEYLSHFVILLCRNGRLFIKDRTGLFLALVQAPIIAAFIVLALYGSVRDYKESDEIMRKSYAFIKAVENDRKNTEVMYENYRRMRANDYYEESVKTAVAEMDGVISPHHAQARATIFFVMISASIWMGLLGSCKEIVTEWKVIHRESHSAFSPTAYILSKLCVLGGVLLLQVFCMVSITLAALMPKDLTFGSLFCHFGVNWLTGFGACVIGLLMSCVIGSIRWALALVPVVMMPQILMGGLLRPPAQVLSEQRNLLREFCSCMTLQRWAFEAELIIDTRCGLSTKDGDVPPSRKVAILSHDQNETSLIYQPKCKTVPLDNYFFKKVGGTLGERLGLPIRVLAGFAVFLTIVTMICLKYRLYFASRGNLWCA